MNAHIDYQIIEQGGKPAFAVLPYDVFMGLIGKQSVIEDGLIPHAIVERNLLNGVPLVKCWREHLGLTQSELADKAGMPQSSVARIEANSNINMRKNTLESLALAMGLTVEQLEE
ncbi:MAG: hypothetical protein ISEC1_P1954 [Thiomicrorhabdus sp.]|nr:MAG: hypothetical protein ISEC1_P1954 [Thiomicrorhabdus sp.]